MKNELLKPTEKKYHVALVFLLVFLSFLSNRISGQTLYVDAQKGKNNATGAINDPILTIDEAIAKTNSFTSRDPVILKLGPGLYTLTHKLVIKTNSTSKNQAYTIEAIIMPDDKAWQPTAMPVIVSLSGNNSTYEFPHCEGMLIAKNNVTIRGLKFMGNPNTQAHYFYPIRREDKSFDGLNVSQCFFIGEANSASIQSAFWTTGSGIHVDHCIFHNSKIAFVLGRNFKDFSLTHSIIDGAYNTAIWYGFDGTIPKFIFKDNIVTNCYYIMVYPVEKGQPDFTFSDSYFINNKNYVGNYPKAQDRFFAEPNKHIKEVNIKRMGKISFVAVADDGITKDNLNLTETSAGKSTGAGIFIKQ
jgi:hypothetical protein